MSVRTAGYVQPACIQCQVDKVQHILLVRCGLYLFLMLSEQTSDCVQLLAVICNRRCGVSRAIAKPNLSHRVRTAVVNSKNYTS